MAGRDGTAAHTLDILSSLGSWYAVAAPFVRLDEARSIWAVRFEIARAARPRGKSWHTLPFGNAPAFRKVTRAARARVHAEDAVVLSAASCATSPDVEPTAPFRILVRRTLWCLCVCRLSARRLARAGVARDRRDERHTLKPVVVQVEVPSPPPPPWASRRSRPSRTTSSPRWTPRDRGRTLVVGPVAVRLTMALNR